MSGVPYGDDVAMDTNTTYSVGDGGLTQNNFTTTLKNKLDAIEDPDVTIGRVSLSENNFTDTLKGKLDNIAPNANNYSLPATVSTNSKTHGQIELTANTSSTSGGTAADILVKAGTSLALRANLSVTARISSNHTNYRGFIIPRAGYYNVSWNVDLYGNGTNHKNMWVFCERYTPTSSENVSDNTLSGGNVEQLGITTQWENDDNSHGHSLSGNWIGLLSQNDVIYFRGKMQNNWVARWYEGSSTNEENHTTIFNIFNID